MPNPSTQTPCSPIPRRTQSNLVDPARIRAAGDKVVIYKEDDRLMVEPVQKTKTLAELLASWEPLEEEFPETEDPPVKPEDIF